MMAKVEVDAISRRVIIQGTERFRGHKVPRNHLRVCSKAFSCPSTDNDCSLAGLIANP